MHLSQMGFDLWEVIPDAVHAGIEGGGYEFGFPAAADTSAHRVHFLCPILYNEAS